MPGGNPYHDPKNGQFTSGPNGFANVGALTNANATAVMGEDGYEHLQTDEEYDDSNESHQAIPDDEEITLEHFPPPDRAKIENSIKAIGEHRTEIENHAAQIELKMKELHDLHAKMSKLDEAITKEQEKIGEIANKYSVDFESNDTHELAAGSLRDEIENAHDYLKDGLATLKKDKHGA